jgi:hypothetical protein
MKIKNKRRQENILEFSKAFEDEDALQSKTWSTNTITKNIATKHFAKHGAQTPKCKVIQKNENTRAKNTSTKWKHQSEKYFNKTRTLEQKMFQQSIKCKE